MAGWFPTTKSSQAQQWMNKEQRVLVLTSQDQLSQTEARVQAQQKTSSTFRFSVRNNTENRFTRLQIQAVVAMWVIPYTH